MDAAQEAAQTWRKQATALLDVRPDLERGDEPFVRIMEAATPLKIGETLVIVAPFEPVPLYEVLGGRGFSHETLCLAPDEWVVRFTRQQIPARP
ncbi:DUF2249 domain-containing protein [Thermogemmatispora carboxidivorans]|uniref:DUF2249 domain-containing protein n=1 Tax=Thermogemmatispora carboxidivorans TaxID=1382306 RepID=UPI0006994FDB|nr:DUF2249 domain-containing protein [Thermogemmatispora carboxidivorans]